ncbi:MAG: hypothetical protein ACK55I_46300, partial [bacterium]
MGLVAGEIRQAVGILLDVVEVLAGPQPKAEIPMPVELARGGDELLRRPRVGVDQPEVGIAARPAIRGEVLHVEIVALADA